MISTPQRKFGLAETPTRQVLSEVAAELGLTRITVSDAVTSLASQVDAAVGDSTWLPRTAWDRLRTAADKWGLALEVADELIDERLAANRTLVAQRQRWTTAILTGSAVAVVVTLA